MMGLVKNWFVVVSVGLLFSSCGKAQNQGEKINGLNLVSENRALDTAEVNPMLNVGANYCAVIPFGFMSDAEDPNLSYDTKWQWYGERKEGTIDAIQKLKEKGMKVMLKPQIWVGHGIFTGRIEMKKKKHWKEFEKNYRKFILDFAELAENEGVEILCIGTELKRFTTNRVEYWEKLIGQIRDVYSGELTYASNWDEVDDISFWDDLDFIGVDAYFPISNSENASLDDLKNGWRIHENLLDSLSSQNELPILFTEYGYRSIPNCANEPWNSSNDTVIDHQAQVNALKALYEVMWNKPNFAGGFLWKWYPDHSKAGGVHDNRFTVQNKAAEEVVRENYKR